jgi:hypothetical protein
MIPRIITLLSAAILALAVPAVGADEKPGKEAEAEGKAAKKPDEPSREMEKAKKEAEAMTKRLSDDAKKKLWEIVTKGGDEELAETKLKPELVTALKEARPNLKGWEDILTTAPLGRDALKQLVDYGGSSKFTKAIEDEKKQKETAEKERARGIKKARQERERNRKSGNEEN